MMRFYFLITLLEYLATNFIKNIFFNVDYQVVIIHLYISDTIMQTILHYMFIAENTLSTLIVATGIINLSVKSK